MLEITTTRHNPFVDPMLSVWSWEIPVYLFLGGMIAGMMVLGGINMLKLARGERPEGFYSVQTPVLGFVLLNLGMGALFLDLAHKLYVYRVYMAFEPTSPMSWGSWVLILVFPVLIVSALIRLPEAWPWLGERVPAARGWSAALLARPGVIKALGYLNVFLGIGLGIYTGILLSTMVARPLWNSAILGPLFLVSGLSAAAAMVHLVASFVPGHPAPRGLVGGALALLVQPLGERPPEPGTATSLVRADLAFLAVELVLIGLLVIGLLSSSASHAAAAQIILSGKFAVLFWAGVIAAGIVVPLLLQLLELGHRIPHTIVPALLVLAGGLALRWVMVGAGQASHVIAATGL
ncbi:MAG TPA: NrfD/PsrC family molybdoenzyme membrane anchor subunit [Usitatibacteraceae bacterium]|nr:NrfD/PsrC family molybdoenzyme membrane anchor subunit [Usitatibacteraceae bacterium]